jgi:hypothetical protein
MRVVHLIDEGQATGQIKQVYRDIQATFAAPIVGSVFRALAARPDVLVAAWRDIRKNAETRSFITLASRLRSGADSIVSATFEFDDLYSWLREHGFGREDMRRIRYSLEMLHFLNPKLLLAIAAMHVSLHGISSPRISRATPSPPTGQEPEFPSKTPKVTIEQAPSDTMEIFLDAIDATGTPVVPDDLQILAAWPTLLRRTWGNLKPVMHSATFIEEAERLSELAVEAAQELPFAINIDGAGIDVRRAVDMFLKLQARMLLASAAVRWMLLEGERLNRSVGRAAGEGTF